MTHQDSGTAPDQPGPSPNPVYGDVPRYGYQQPGAAGDPSGPPPPSYQPSYEQSYAPYSGYQPPPAGQPPYAYGQPQQPYAAGYSGYAAPVYDYASWFRRVGAYLIDFLPNFIALIPFYVGYFIWVISLAQQSDLAPGEVPDFTAGLSWMAVGGLLLLAALGWQIYNRWITAGRTGQSLGKRVLKIKLVAEATGQPIGPLNAFLRDLVHILDGLVYIGYLWPLWDEKRRTFADMLMKTVVTNAPTPPPTPAAA